MRGPSAVIACAVFLGVTFGATFATSSSNQAWAQKKKVVVVSFKGPAADKYRIAVMKSVYRQGIDVVPDRQLAKVEADLGLQKVSDSWSGIARELKLSGFVSGIITGGRRPKARVIVHNADGKPVGGQIFQATSAPKLMAMVSAGSGPKVAAVLGTLGGGAPAAEPAAGKDEPVAAAEEETPRKRKRGEDAEEAKDGEKADEPGGDDADAEVAAEADDSDEPAAKRKKSSGKNLRLAANLRMFSRNFKYNQSVRGRQQGYQAPESRFKDLPLVPAPGVALEFFPVSMVGVFGSYNKAIASSKDTAGSVYTTNAYSYAVGAKGRVPMFGIELEPSVSYGSHAFKIDNFSSSPDRIQVAPVDYKHARLGGGIRLPLESGGAFSLGAAYLHILSAGEILTDKYFAKGSAIGGEIGADLVLPLSFMKGLDVSIGADFRRIAFAFNQPMSAARIAGGAIDQYIGLNLGLGYNLGL